MTTRARNVLRNYVNMDESLDAVLEKCLAVCGGRSPHDAVVVALHACLLSEGFVCIATGDENFGEGISASSPVSFSSSPSNLYGLPVGWNASQEVYALQYYHQTQRKMVLVKIIVIETQLLISAMSASDMETVHSITLETNRYVKSQQFNSVSVYSNLLQLVSTLNKDVVGKLLQQPPTIRPVPQGSSTLSTTSTSGVGRGRDDNDPLRVGPPRHPGIPSANPLIMPPPFGYGDADRFPFGGGAEGGGMIFDPLRGRGPGGLGGGGGFGGPFPPRGHVPGARWDPVTPFGGSGGGLPGTRGGRGRLGRLHGEPDPDHLPPPGSDNMFS